MTHFVYSCLYTFTYWGRYWTTIANKECVLINNLRNKKCNTFTSSNTYLTYRYKYSLPVASMPLVEVYHFLDLC